MSEPRRVLLVGASGMVGQAVMRAAVGREDLRIVALGRRAAMMPAGARMEQLVAAPAQWPAAIAAIRPDAVILALGTTIAAVGGDKAAFRAVDHDLTLSCAKAAHDAGARQAVLVSSVGADPAAKLFYAAVKGETEADLGKLDFARLDILRPGLLVGRREGPLRLGERIGMTVLPLLDPLLAGRFSDYRSIRASTVAAAALACLGATPAAPARVTIHTGREIHRLAQRG